MNVSVPGSAHHHHHHHPRHNDPAGLEIRVERLIERLEEIVGRGLLDDYYHRHAEAAVKHLKDLPSGVRSEEISSVLRDAAANAGLQWYESCTLSWSADHIERKARA